MHWLDQAPADATSTLSLDPADQEMGEHASQIKMESAIALSIPYAIALEKFRMGIIQSHPINGWNAELLII